MKRFYPDFESIHAFTVDLDYHQDELACAHCFKHDQFVSHGIIYKQRSSTLAEKVGKRLFCSNRYGRSGCGRTVQLYIAAEVPGCRYGTSQLFLFITALIENVTIHEAYHHATGQPEPRHAWRWLKRLKLKLCHYRCVLKDRTQDNDRILRSSSQYLQHLLPTLVRMFSSMNNGCRGFQINQQQSFL